MSPPPTRKTTWDHVGPYDGFQPAVDGVDARKEQQSDDSPHHRYAEHLVHGKRPEPCHRREIDEQVEHEEEDREGHADPAAVPLVEQLRHCVDPLPDHDRQQVFRHDDERCRCDPFVGGDSDSDPESRSGHADELFRRDVRCDQRSTDGPPGEVPARQKIVRGAFLPARTGYEQPDCDDDQGICAEDDVIGCLKSDVHCMRSVRIGIQKYDSNESQSRVIFADACVIFAKMDLAAYFPIFYVACQTSCCPFGPVSCLFRQHAVRILHNNLQIPWKIGLRKNPNFVMSCRLRQSTFFNYINTSR